MKSDVGHPTGRPAKIWAAFLPNRAPEWAWSDYKPLPPRFLFGPIETPTPLQRGHSVKHLVKLFVARSSRLPGGIATQYLEVTRGGCLTGGAAALVLLVLL